jgi:hypothetical protein
LDAAFSAIATTRTRTSRQRARQANEPEAQYDVAFLDEDSVYLLAFHRAEADQ